MVRKYPARQLAAAKGQMPRLRRKDRGLSLPFRIVRRPRVPRGFPAVRARAGDAFRLRRHLAGRRDGGDRLGKSFRLRRNATRLFSAFRGLRPFPLPRARGALVGFRHRRRRRVCGFSAHQGRGQAHRPAGVHGHGRRFVHGQHGGARRLESAAVLRARRLRRRGDRRIGPRTPARPQARARGGNKGPPTVRARNAPKT